MLACRAITAFSNLLVLSFLNSPLSSSSLRETSVFHTQVCHLAPPTPLTMKVIFFHPQSQAEYATQTTSSARTLHVSKQEETTTMAYPQKNSSLIPILVTRLDIHS